MRSANCSPISYPMLPPTHQHHMWYLLFTWMPRTWLLKSTLLSFRLCWRILMLISSQVLFSQNNLQLLRCGLIMDLNIRNRLSSCLSFFRSGSLHGPCWMQNLNLVILFHLGYLSSGYRFYLVNVIGFVHLCFWDDSSIWVGTIPRYGSLGRTSGSFRWLCCLVCWNISICSKVVANYYTGATADSWSTSLSSMKHVRGSTWRKNSDEKRKILGHSIAADNIHEIMAVEVEC
ncbi:hypothetical protein RHGRI_025695 [Rhododendron griersonianum]|uniref:Uncharacterized protein n=1 Tax=Rhododendron griersonianum TaxID=479676 RepID=A0AAV6IVF6_9ERIC|nr:hypothetical protein RHGRI_025695 [Rhododendron griersonianum]